MTLRVSGKNLDLGADGSSFTVIAGEESQDVRLGVPGRHNASNALAAIAATRQLGVSLEDAVAALERFEGLKRRFETVGTAAGVTVIDDFAHNPDKIDATLATLRQSDGRLLIMFQPHGYGPLAKMGDELAASFARGMASGDKLFLPDPVYQGGTVERTRGSDWLAERVRAAGAESEHIPERTAIGEALLAECLLDRLVNLLDNRVAGDRADNGLGLVDELTDGGRLRRDRGPLRLLRLGDHWRNAKRQHRRGCQ